MNVDRLFQMLSIHLNNFSVSCVSFMQGMTYHLGFGVYIIPKRML